MNSGDEIDENGKRFRLSVPVFGEYSTVLTGIVFPAERDVVQECISIPHGYSSSLDTQLHAPLFHEHWSVAMPRD